jgi:hypothetical protein
MEVRFHTFYISFQAEVYSIKACLAENLHRIYMNRNIYIPSDSQAAIKGLSSHRITSKLVWDCHQLPQATERKQRATCDT